MFEIFNFSLIEFVSADQKVSINTAFYTAKHTNLVLSTDPINVWRYFLWGKDGISFEK